MTQRILIVEDEDLFARSVATRLARDGHECAIASSLANARDALADPVDLLLLDMRLPDGSGLEFLGEKPAPPAIMITAFGDIENAVTAMKRGAVDYLRKPIDLDELAIVVDRTLATRQMETRLAYSRERDTHRSGGGELLGKSPAIGKVRREIAAFAAHGGGVGAPPVLILGETGSGKNVAAHLIHDCRLGADRPLVHIDCASLARGTPTPELFGDDRGPGLIEAAEDGTVLLDEVSALAPDVQGVLLNVVERRRLRRTGGRREIPVAASFVATSNRDLPALVHEGAFRRDLYHRLDTLHLEMPPLRDCGDDAVTLARHFIAQAASRYGRPEPRLADPGAAALVRYPWPGNVRELRHVVERAVLLDDDGRIGEADLPAIAPATPRVAAAPTTLASAERQLMNDALAASRGNVSAAARRLGITRMAMRYRMKKHGL